MVLVAGEAGAGKTSLVRAFLLGLDGVVDRVEGACDPLETPRPLGPLHDFADDPAGVLAGFGVGHAAAIDVFGSVLSRLRAAERPVVMLIEDVHWADEGTLDFLRYVARRIGTAPAVAICTYRDDEVGVGHPLRTVLGQIAALATVERMAVPSLTLDAVARLAASAAIDPEHLHRVTEGNPFYVTEVLAAGGQLPATVSDAVLARVARLDEPARRVVEAVSIAPRFADIDEVRALASVDDDHVDRAVAAGVLVGDGRRLRFRHELARAAVEQSLPPGRRLTLHRRMIEILRSTPSGDRARLAHHAVRTASADLVVEYAPPAAAEAVARGARREAVAFVRAALEHPDALGPERTADMQVLLATQLLYLDQAAAAEGPLRAAIDRYRATDQPEKLAEALGRLQSSLWNLNRVDEGLAAMDEALAVLEPLGPSEALVSTLHRVAHRHMVARRRAPALESIGRAASVAGEVDAAPRTGWIVTMMRGTIQLVLGDADEGVKALRGALEDAVARSDPALFGTALGMLGSGGGEARRYRDAIDALEQGIAHGLATDDDHGVAYDRSWMARIAFEQGRWDDAVEWVELVDRTCPDRRGIAMLTAMSALGRVRVRRGDPGGMAVLDEMVALARLHELQHGWNAVCGRAEHLWLADRADESLDELVPAFERALDTDSEWARGELGFWMWRVGAIEEAPDGAAEPYRLQMSGRWHEAAQAWRSIGCPYETAMALADGDESSRLDALEILAGLGARPLADRLRAELRQAGVDRLPRGPRRRTRQNPAGLTARQLDVLELVVQGLSNGEIAARLFVSTKTVEHHVSAIYTKLGVTTRARAVAVGAELTAPS